MSSEQERFIANNGERDGEALVRSQYPYLVERDIAAVTAKARGIIKKKMDEARGQAYVNNIFSLSQIHTSVQEKYKEQYEAIYINTYAKAYFDTLAKLDKEAGITPTMPTAPSPTGATITVTGVDRSSPNAYVYYVELVDPGYIDGVFQPEPLTVVFEPEAPTASSSSSFSVQASSFSDTTRASTSSNAIPSRNPQIGKKPTGSHWGKQ